MHQRCTSQLWSSPLDAGTKVLQVKDDTKYRGPSEIPSTFVPARPCPLCLRGLEESRVVCHQPNMSEVRRTGSCSNIALGSSRHFKLSF